MKKPLEPSVATDGVVAPRISNQKPLPLMERMLGRKQTMRQVRDRSGLNYRTLRKRMDDPSQFVMSDFTWLSELLELSPEQVFALVQAGIKELAADDAVSVFKAA